MFLGYAYKLKAQTLALENMFTNAKCGSRVKCMLPAL